ncbi:MAG: hypothetical protein WA532_09885 [Candidatus Korobacteraceae bacterium]
MSRFYRGRGAIALADQIMVSGSNFVAGIILVRGLGLVEFGKYSVAYLLLLYANSLQMSFITSPMLSLAPLMPVRERRQFVNGMLTLQLLASLLLFVTFALAGTASCFFTTFYSLPCVLVFALCVGSFQLQDWVRRYYFLCNKKRLAIASDFISYGVQLALLLALWRAGGLTLVRTFMVMAVTSLAGFALGPVTDRIRPATQHLLETWARCKVLSRDLLIANQVRWFGVQGVLLMGTGIVGVAAAGGLRAASNLAGPMYLLLLACENVVPIHIAELLQTKGAASACEFVKHGILATTVSFSLLILPLSIFGRTILRLLYGPAMVAFYIPLLLQMVNTVVQAAVTLSFYLFRGLRDTRALLRANALSAMASVGTVYLFGHQWKAPGIVLSSLFGQVIVVAYFFLHWMRHRRELLLRYPPPKLSETEAESVRWKVKLQILPGEVTTR